ncbi:MAG: hypothetical protein PVG63_05380 [Anaerolineales bacterium]|jgi:hypothetical protein
MSINQILPFLSTIVMAIFTISVLQRWWVRRKPHFLFWGLGLAMFGLGSFAEAYFSVANWNPFIFFLWYLFGAALNAAWIGHGTLLLLIRKDWVRIITVILVVGSVAAGVMMLQAMPLLDGSQFDPGLPISEQYAEIMPAIDNGGLVRLTTPFFNIYGLVTLVGGALWSAWRFLKKKVLPNRVIGNVLIAAGALSIAMASSLTRAGYGAYLYLGELIAAILMYAGFVMAAAPQPDDLREPAKAAAGAQPTA